VTPEAAAALARAKAHLDPQRLYPRPLDLRRVRLMTVPWLFRLPWFRRFDGYTMWSLILLRRPLERTGAELVTHEACHVWQMQHRPLRMPLSYLVRGYDANPYELEARCAAAGAADALAEDVALRRPLQG
jgi:hypothetical protein